MPKCPKCGVNYPDGANYCPACRHSPAPVVRSFPLQPGETVCLDYEIEELLRTDHNGDRYLGAHKLTRQPVTVEVLSPVLTESARQQVLAEARVLSRFHHPTLPVMYTIREEFRRIWIVFQHPEGIPLSYMLAKKNFPSQEIAVKIFEQVLSGLDHTHRQGLFHGALRPSLVFVDDMFNVMIGGFGFLKALNQPQAGAERDFTTAFYTAPETALGQNADHRTDIYHTAILFFHSVSGRPPFTGGSNYEIIRGHVEEIPPDLHSICTTVSQRVSEVIAKALAKDPKDRFQSAREFRNALLHAHKDSSAKIAAPDFSTNEHRPSPEGSQNVFQEIRTNGNVSGTLMGLPQEPKPPQESRESKTGEKHVSPARNFTGDIPAGKKSGEPESRERKRSSAALRETIKTRPPAPAPAPTPTPAPVEPEPPEDTGKPLPPPLSHGDADLGRPLQPHFPKGPGTNLARLSLKRITVHGGAASEKVTPLQTPAVAEVQAQKPEKPAEAKQQAKPQPTVQQEQPAEAKQQAEPQPTVQQEQPAEAKQQAEPQPTVQQEQPAEAKQQAEPQPTEQQEKPAEAKQQAEPQPTVQQEKPAEAKQQAEPQPTVQQEQPEQMEQIEHEGDSESMRHESDEEHGFFSSEEPQPSSAADDFSDLEVPFSHRSSKTPLIVTLTILGLVCLGVGFYLAYTFWLNPYARVEKGSELIRPPAETRPPETTKPHPPADFPEEEFAEKADDKSEEAEIDETDPPDETDELVAEDMEPAEIEPPAADEPEVEAKVKAARDMWKKNRKKAIALLEEVIETHPAHGEAGKMLASHYDERAWSALNRGSWNASLELAEKALKYDPKSRKSWFCVGYVKRMRKENEEAKKAFNAYLNLCKTSKCKMESYAKKYVKSL